VQDAVRQKMRATLARPVDPGVGAGQDGAMNMRGW
jgi:hypothetical protein